MGCQDGERWDGERWDGERRDGEQLWWLSQGPRVSSRHTVMQELVCSRVLTWLPDRQLAVLPGLVYAVSPSLHPIFLKKHCHMLHEL